MTSFLFTVYVPAAMIVFLSTLSFWIRPGSVPARIALGITTVLAEATVMSGALNAYPRVSYLKALDLYTMVCFCFTFGGLIEYAIVHITMNKMMYVDDQDKVGISFTRFNMVWCWEYIRRRICLTVKPIFAIDFKRSVNNTGRECMNIGRVYVNCYSYFIVAFDHCFLTSRFCNQTAGRITKWLLKQIGAH